MARLPSRRSWQNTVDVSVEDEDVDVFPSEPPPHRPSRLRSFFVKLFVFLVLTAVLLLVATELSIVLQRPWLDPRPYLREGLRQVLLLVR